MLELRTAYSRSFCGSRDEIIFIETDLLEKHRKKSHPSVAAPHPTSAACNPLSADPNPPSKPPQVPLSGVFQGDFYHIGSEDTEGWEISSNPQLFKVPGESHARPLRGSPATSR